MLDVGCGCRKRGDVNVDIDVQCQPDIICDIHNLPFRDEQFDIVFCYHVIEHKGVEPDRAIKELIRVCNGIVQIQIPHWLSINAKKDPTHQNFQVMNRRWWLKYKPKEMVLSHVSLIGLLPFLTRPNDITVQIQ